MQQQANTNIDMTTKRKSPSAGKLHVVTDHVPTTNILALITSKLEVLQNVTVTPEMAKDILTLNTSNRPVRADSLKKYTVMMENGKWLFAGNTIKVSKENILQDGQKTLMAIVASDRAQMLNIQTGLDTLAFTVMDANQVRSAGDVLSVMGYDHPNTMAAAIKTIIYYDTHKRMKNNIRYNFVTNQQVEQWLEHKENSKRLITCTDFVMKEILTIKSARFLATSTWTFIYYLLYKIHRGAATEFIQRLAGGQNISMKSHAPIYFLRERLLNFGQDLNHLKVIGAGGTAATELKLRYILRAWNLWRKNEKITALKIDTKVEELEKPL